MHARANLFGLGPGCYPKARTPRPPYHLFCWCRVRSRPDLETVGAREVPGGEAAYLSSLSPDEAGRVMGSKERAARVMDGARVDDVTNAGKDAAYRLARVGDGPALRHALGAENARVNEAYQTAKAGGAHSGLIRRYAGESDRQVEKALRSLDRRIDEHLDKIANPRNHVDQGTGKAEIGYLVASYWPKEVDNFRREADVLRGVLQERKNGQ